MAISLYLSGGTSNASPLGSLGGEKSASPTLPSLFGAIGESVYANGITLYCCIYVVSTTAASDIKAFIKRETVSTSTTVALAWGTSAVNGVEQTIASRTVAPVGVTFSTPATIGAAISGGALAANQHKAIWVRYTIQPLVNPPQTESFTLTFDNPPVVGQNDAIRLLSANWPGVTILPLPTTGNLTNRYLRGGDFNSSIWATSGTNSWWELFNSGNNNPSTVTAYGETSIKSVVDRNGISKSILSLALKADSPNTTQESIRITEYQTAGQNDSTRAEPIFYQRMYVKFDTKTLTRARRVGASSFRQTFWEARAEPDFRIRAELKYDTALDMLYWSVEIDNLTGSLVMHTATSTLTPVILSPQTEATGWYKIEAWINRANQEFRFAVNGSNIMSITAASLMGASGNVLNFPMFVHLAAATSISGSATEKPIEMLVDDFEIWTKPPTNAWTATTSGLNVVPDTYFGMNFGGLNDYPWPSVAFKGLRLWDSWGYNSINGAYTGIGWGNLHSAANTFNWELFDSFMVKLAANNQVGFYTFGNAPVWLTGASTTPPTTSAHLTHWDAFVTAIVTRAAGRIKCWGMWNEPNASMFYTGTAAQLVAMAARAYPIIKSIDPTAIVCSPEVQGNGAGWLGDYFTAGGAAYTDVIAIHMYGYPDNRAATSGGSMQAITAYRAAADAAGLTSKQIWNTEFSQLGIYDTDHVAYIGKTYPLYWAAGVRRNYWYQWDNSNVINGQMWTAAGGSNAAATAFVQVQQWLTGAQVSTIPNVNGSVWYLDITRTNYEGRIVWHAGGSSNFTITAGKYIRYRTLSGSTVAIAGGATSVGITNVPILLETAAPQSGATWSNGDIWNDAANWSDTDYVWRNFTAGNSAAFWAAAAAGGTVAMNNLSYTLPSGNNFMPSGLTVNGPGEIVINGDTDLLRLGANNTFNDVTFTGNLSSLTQFTLFKDGVSSYFASPVLTATSVNSTVIPLTNTKRYAVFIEDGFAASWVETQFWKSDASANDVERWTGVAAWSGIWLYLTGATHLKIKLMLPTAQQALRSSYDFNKIKIYELANDLATINGTESLTNVSIYSNNTVLNNPVFRKFKFAAYKIVNASNCRVNGGYVRYCLGGMTTQTGSDNVFDGIDSDLRMLDNLGNLVPSGIAVRNHNFSVGSAEARCEITNNIARGASWSSEHAEMDVVGTFTKMNDNRFHAVHCCVSNASTNGEVFRNYCKISEGGFALIEVPTANFGRVWDNECYQKACALDSYGIAGAHGWQNMSVLRNTIRAKTGIQYTGSLSGLNVIVQNNNIRYFSQPFGGALIGTTGNTTTQVG